MERQDERIEHVGKRDGSVRIGPVSVFSLVVILCLAVMAVLTVTTAQAAYTAAEKQARFTTDTYLNEQAAQNFVAEIDGALADARSDAGTSPNLKNALAAVEPVVASYDDAAIVDDQVQADFTTENGRTLSVVLTIKDDATYEISQWRATTQWNEADSGEILWSGSSRS